VFVYAVTSYTAPRQTERLVARLRRDRPDARLIVSHDRKMPPPSVDALAAAGAELWLTADPITWGDATYLKSLLAVISQAELGPGDWITILTGQDYPIRPLRDYESHLASGGADMVLEEPDDDPRLPLSLERYLVRSYRLPRWTGRHRIRQVMKHVQGFSMSSEPRGLPPYLHRRRLRTPFDESFTLRKGSDLFALSGRAAAALREADPKLLRYFARTRIPSESYIHTVLRNDSRLRNSAGMLHYARWYDSPHPVWLTESDLDAMLLSGRWFARKFREDDPVLDHLDRILDSG
jgi:Core-2/I-Branching enzyme